MYLCDNISLIKVLDNAIITDFYRRLSRGDLRGHVLCNFRTHDDNFAHSK